MQGLAKGLAVLECFVGGHDRLTAADAARMAGLTRATARRCLLTLVDLGYLTYDGKFFRPLPKMLRIGGAYLTGNPLPQHAQAILAAARDRIGESVSLAILDGPNAVFVARAAVPRLVSTGVNVGAALPAYCSATGRVLLAGLADDEVRARLDQASRLALTPRTRTDPAALLQVVQAVRREGFALVEEELELGMRSLAVPVRDREGRVVAAMSVSAASARVSSAVMTQEFLPVLREFSETLGGRL